MRRFAMDKLLDWKKKSNRKPLILMGARQVGKTWLMKEFGKTYYEKTAYISFYNNQRMQAVFDTDFDIKRIIMNLNIESGVAIDLCASLSLHKLKASMCIWQSRFADIWHRYESTER